MLQTTTVQPTTGLSGDDLDRLSINALKMLAVDAIQWANSGHPGLPMGVADMAYVLWTRHLRHNPANPTWPNRDRFVLSAGHGSMLLYALLHLTDYDLSLDDIRNFRQWGSRTPGHPEYGLTPGVETTTGPLGQGFANGVGMALAEQFLAARFNRPGYRVVDHHVYVLCSDGDLMEGVASEAASLAGHLGLGKLICLYDDNRISIDGSTELTFTEDVAGRFEAYGWHVQSVDGYDLATVDRAIRLARREVERPSLILALTEIGRGSPNKAGSAAAHGEPLGEDEVRRTKANLNWPAEPAFHIPEVVRRHLGEARAHGQASEAAWQGMFNAYSETYPNLADQFRDAMEGRLPDGWDRDMPAFQPDDGPLATRAASGEVLNAIAPRLPALLGGSADLSGSNNTYLKGHPPLKAGDFSGRNLHFGVREHAMGAILNGMALHGGIIPYGGTFLVFSDYMRPAMRLAALMELRVVFVLTHDSIFLGEDGPTHQPVEHLMALRTIPNLTVIRPADANEVAAAWRVALEHDHGPVALILTRQKLPVLDRHSLGDASQLRRGGYTLTEAGHRPDLILIATGSEVSLALAAGRRLAEQGVRARVVNLPSWELFDAQPASYRESVLPPDVPARLAIEAGITQGWERYVGLQGDVVGIDRFGASAPGQVLAEKFGFTVDNVVRRALALLK